MPHPRALSPVLAVLLAFLLARPASAFVQDEGRSAGADDANAPGVYVAAADGSGPVRVAAT